MDIRVGDILEMKKNHPCGCKQFLVVRAGMDFKIQCKNCGRLVEAPRPKIEKSVKKLYRGEPGAEAPVDIARKK